MQNLFKGKIATIIILIATFVLAGVAVFTAIRLYQLRQVPVAPNVPGSAPKADDNTEPICSLSFNLATPTPTPSPTPSPSGTPTASPTPVPQCNSVCTTSADCPDNLTCSAGYCRKAICVDEENCVCATATPTATPTSSPSPTPSPSPSHTPGVTNTPSPTPTQVAKCNNNCTSNSDCPTDLMCNIASGAASGNCRNASCTGESDCLCGTTTPSPTPTSTSIAYVTTPAPTQPTLPESGTDWTTYFGIGIGILTIIGSLILAL